MSAGLLERRRRRRVRRLSNAARPCRSGLPCSASGTAPHAHRADLRHGGIFDRGTRALPRPPFRARTGHQSALRRGRPPSREKDAHSRRFAVCESAISFRPIGRPCSPISAEPLLIVGNPPWVTNSALGVLGQRQPSAQAKPAGPVGAGRAHRQKQFRRLRMDDFSAAAGDFRPPGDTGHAVQNGRRPTRAGPRVGDSACRSIRRKCRPLMRPSILRLASTPACSFAVSGIATSDGQRLSRLRRASRVGEAIGHFRLARRPARRGCCRLRTRQAFVRRPSRSLAIGNQTRLFGRV